MGEEVTLEQRDVNGGEIERNREEKTERRRVVRGEDTEGGKE